MKAVVLSVLFLGGVVACCGQSQQNTAGAATGGFSPEELRAFTALNPIDTHTHVRRNEPAFDAMLDRLNLHLLDIVLANDRDEQEKDLSAESKLAWDFIRGSGGRAALCTSIDPYKMREPGFAAMAIRGLNHDFKKGAVAVKIWKNIGMEIKDADGNYVLPDDPVFAPIYKDIAAHNKTLIAHVADPDSAWAPPNPASPDYSYYSENPSWYMYDKPHPASKEQILRARDHILEQNKNLRLVGAHLGSMEADFNVLAQHFDRYPNFAVDMAARMPYLAMQPRADAIAFILKYQDRLIYGTDLAFGAKDPVEARVKSWELVYARDWRFLATNDTVDVEGHTAQGLALPDAVLRKIYHGNAVKWFPGILNASH